MKKKNTGVRIEATQEVLGNGKEGYRIDKIIAFKKSELPALYLSKGAVVYLSLGAKNSLCLVQDDADYKVAGRCAITEGDFVIWSDMENLLGHVSEAGSHLQKVNAKLKEQRADWHGRAVFIDGDKQELPVQEKPSTDPPARQKVQDEMIKKLREKDRLYYKSRHGDFLLIREIIK